MGYLKVKKRPVVKLVLSKSDKLIEALTLGLLVLLWVFLYWKFSTLSEVIPSHFDVKGNVNGFADKSFLWEMPAIATVIYLLMTIANQFPQTFTYPEEITKENALSEYTTATRTLRVLKFVVVVVCGLVVFFIANYTI